jgi:hypothetical protein
MVPAPKSVTAYVLLFLLFLIAAGVGEEALRRAEGAR